jgi:hypothetical protein
MAMTPGKHTHSRKMCYACNLEYTPTGNFQRFCSEECQLDYKKETYLPVWRRKSRRFLALHGAKDRARKRNINFDLSLEDIPEIPDLCPVLGIPIVTNEGKPGFHNNSPSLDRIYNDKGYVRGNVRFISFRANHLKSDASLEELEKLVEDARLFRY